LPFFFIYAPITLLRPDAGFATSFLQVIAILMVIFSLQIGVSRYCFTNLKWDEATTFIIASIFSLAAVFTRNPLFFFIGLALFAASIARQFLMERKLRVQTGGGGNPIF
jgi:TRAP-type uncharacterized transport system fused permease subunit